MATKICFLLLFLAIVEETNARPYYVAGNLSPAFVPVKGLLIPHYFFQNVLKINFFPRIPFFAKCC